MRGRRLLPLLFSFSSLGMSVDTVCDGDESDVRRRAG